MRGIAISRRLHKPGPSHASRRRVTTQKLVNRVQVALLQNHHRAPRVLDTSSVKSRRKKWPTFGNRDPAHLALFKPAPARPPPLSCIPTVDPASAQLRHRAAPTGQAFRLRAVPESLQARPGLQSSTYSPRPELFLLLRHVVRMPLSFFCIKPCCESSSDFKIYTQTRPHPLEGHYDRFSPDRCHNP